MERKKYRDRAIKLLPKNTMMMFYSIIGMVIAPVIYLIFFSKVWLATMSLVFILSFSVVSAHYSGREGYEKKIDKSLLLAFGSLALVGMYFGCGLNYLLFSILSSVVILGLLAMKLFFLVKVKSTEDYLSFVEYFIESFRSKVRIINQYRAYSFKNYFFDYEGKLFCWPRFKGLIYFSMTIGLAELTYRLERFFVNAFVKSDFEVTDLNRAQVKFICYKFMIADTVNFKNGFSRFIGFFDKILTKKESKDIRDAVNYYDANKKLFIILDIIKHGIYIDVNRLLRQYPHKSRADALLLLAANYINNSVYIGSDESRLGVLEMFRELYVDAYPAYIPVSATDAHGYSLEKKMLHDLVLPLVRAGAVLTIRSINSDYQDRDLFAVVSRESKTTILRECVKVQKAAFKVLFDAFVTIFGKCAAIKFAKNRTMINVAAFLMPDYCVLPDIRYRENGRDIDRAALLERYFTIVFIDEVNKLTFVNEYQEKHKYR